jgi:hypothetical protein
MTDILNREAVEFHIKRLQDRESNPDPEHVVLEPGLMLPALLTIDALAEALGLTLGALKEAHKVINTKGGGLYEDCSHDVCVAARAANAALQESGYVDGGTES